MKTIYCIGDSFTAGTELADADYYRSAYPGYTTMSIEDDKKREEYRNWWFKNTFKVNQSGILHSTEKERAWPNKLSTILNSDTINAGTAGKSMKYIANRLITDLISLKNKIDLVVVQYTDPSRIEFWSFDESITMFLTNKNPYELHSKLQNILLELETDYSLYYSWLMQLMRIQDFCTANNIPVIFTNSVVDLDNYKFSNRVEIAAMENYLNKPALSMMDVARSINLQTSVFCAGNHFTEIVHDRFAEELSKIIKDRNLL